MVDYHYNGNTIGLQTLVGSSLVAIAVPVENDTLLEIRYIRGYNYSKPHRQHRSLGK